MPNALVIGCSGQDGAYLCELLLRKGYGVLGIGRTHHNLLPGVTFRQMDVCDAAGVARLIADWKPEEIYFLAAFHHSSEEVAGYGDGLFRKSFDINTLALADLLGAVAVNCPTSRVFYAASSLIFGDPADEPQTEATPLNPRCAYGMSKAAGLQICRYYRTHLNVYASVGILYNHESPRRSERFVSKKIVNGVRAILNGQRDHLEIADPNARVDWGYAPDYVEAMWRILRVPEAGDYIVASGETHSVREFVECVCRALGMSPCREIIRESSSIALRRQSKQLTGDASKLKSLTGWRPSVSFREMVERLALDDSMAAFAETAHTHEIEHSSGSQ